MFTVLADELLLNILDSYGSNSVNKMIFIYIVEEISTDQYIFYKITSEYATALHSPEHSKIPQLARIMITLNLAYLNSEISPADLVFQKHYS